MEPAKIDWDRLESVFIVDQLYENINAPQWVDFLDPSDGIDDEAWFCHPDCKHPKTPQDFLKSTPTSKLLRSVSVSKLMGFGNLKRRGGQAQCSEDNENQNPNFSTPPPPNHNKVKALKASIKSSAQKTTLEEVEMEDDYSEILLHSDDKQPKPRLRSTQSARDLFGGRDIFNKITDFCHELKKMATWAKERQVDQAEKPDSRMDQNPLDARKKECGRVVMGSISEKKMDRRKPFTELGKDTCEAAERSNTKKKLRKKKILDDDDDETENIPICLNLNLKDVKRKEEESLLPIRTNPPTPQGFSASKTTPSKGPKSRLKEREMFQELREEVGERSHMDTASPSPLGGGREGRALDVFWFLKPCTLSS